jgi:hypothetical protein
MGWLVTSEELARSGAGLWDVLAAGPGTRLHTRQREVPSTGRPLASTRPGVMPRWPAGGSSPAESAAAVSGGPLVGVPRAQGRWLACSCRQAGWAAARFAGPGARSSRGCAARFTRRLTGGCQHQGRCVPAASRRRAGLVWHRRVGGHGRWAQRRRDGVGRPDRLRRPGCGGAPSVGRSPAARRSWLPASAAGSRIMTSCNPPGVGGPPLGWLDGLPQNRRRDYCECLPGRAGRAGGHLPPGRLALRLDEGGQAA